MTAMDEFRSDFLKWCTEEKQSLERQLALFSGTATMQVNGQPITDEVCSSLRRCIEEMDALIKKVRHEKAGDR